MADKCKSCVAREIQIMTNAETYDVCLLRQYPCDMIANCDYIIAKDKAPTADVQPVDRWISVDVALPIYDGLVLICYNDKTIRLAIYSEDGWYSDEGNPIMEQPDFWLPIPEPPKTKKG